MPVIYCLSQTCRELFREPFRDVSNQRNIVNFEKKNSNPEMIDGYNLRYLLHYCEDNETIPVTSLSFDSSSLYQFVTTFWLWFPGPYIGLQQYRGTYMAEF